MYWLPGAQCSIKPHTENLEAANSASVIDHTRRRLSQSTRTDSRMVNIDVVGERNLCGEMSSFIDVA